MGVVVCRVLRCNGTQEQDVLRIRIVGQLGLHCASWDHPWIDQGTKIRKNLTQNTKIMGGIWLKHIVKISNIIKSFNDSNEVKGLKWSINRKNPSVLSVVTYRSILITAPKKRSNISYHLGFILLPTKPGQALVKAAKPEEKGQRKPFLIVLEKVTSCPKNSKGVQQLFCFQMTVDSLQIGFFQNTWF